MRRDDIHAFWTRQAEAHGQDPAASWSDVRVIELEIAAIASYLEPGARVLDVGCANGYSSVHYAQRGVDLVGIDYVPEMIASANERRDALPAELRERVEFHVGDATALDFGDGEFDAVISTRVVINLGAWDAQRTALAELVRVLRPGGILLLSEATIQGWQRLNALRAEWGLDDIPMPSFNTYLDENRVVDELRAACDLVELRNFASSYYVATRFVKPLLARLAPAAVDVADPNAELNRLAAQLPAAGDYGTQKLFVLRKH